MLISKKIYGIRGTDVLKENYSNESPEDFSHVYELNVEIRKLREENAALREELRKLKEQTRKNMGGEHVVSKECQN